VSTLKILLTYRQGFLAGLSTTLELSLIIWSVGLSVGLATGYLVDRYPLRLRTPFNVLAFLLSGIPVIVFLVWAHYPLQVLLNVVIDPFFTACWVLSLVNTMAVAEILSSALREFPTAYITAAKVCGISRRQTFWKIKLPIILRQVLPGIVTSQVAILQATLFASLISVEEIFRVSQRINATAYKPVQIYTALALLFLAICLPLNGFALWFRNRFTKIVTEDY
jgi:ABC-type amino acid transport system permease subunit